MTRQLMDARLTEDELRPHLYHRVAVYGDEEAVSGLFCETCGEYIVELPRASQLNVQIQHRGPVIDIFYDGRRQADCCCPHGNIWPEGDYYEPEGKACRTCVEAWYVEANGPQADSAE